MPSRNLFDLLPLMTLAKNRYQLYALIASGWMAALIALPAMKTPDANEAAAVPFVFLPLLVMQLAPKAWGVFVHQSRLYQRSPPGTPA
jgi:hypothetical protein